MYPVSQEYITAMRQPIIQDVEHHIEIDLSIVNLRFLKEFSSGIFSYETFWEDSVLSQKNGSLFTIQDEPVDPYITFEENYFTLGTGMDFFDAQTTRTGIVTQQLMTPNENNTPYHSCGSYYFFRPEMNGTLPFRCVRMFVEFDKMAAPKDVFLYLYHDIQFGQTPGRPEMIRPGIRISDNVMEFDVSEAEDIRFGILYAYNQRPNTRFRINKIMMGLNKTFTEEELTGDFVHEFDMDPTLCRLPQQKMNFTISNKEGMYSVDNPNGIYQFLEKGQPVRARLKVKHLASGKEEWIPICDMCLTGQVDVSEKSATFYATSYLQSAVEKGNNFMGHLHDMIIDMGEKLNLPDTRDGKDRFYSAGFMYTEQNLVEHVDFSDKQLNQCLQIAAQAATELLFEDYEGRIYSHFIAEFFPYIKNQPYFRPEVSKPYTLEDIYAQFSVKKYPKIGTVSVAYYDDSNQEHLLEKKYGAGEKQEIRNQYIQNEAHAAKTEEYISYLLSMQDEYTVNIRGGAEIEPYDRVHAQVRPGKTFPAVITYRKLTYNGALKSTVKYLVQGSEF